MFMFTLIQIIFVRAGQTALIALRALRRNKLRSSLTALGIIIGVASVVAMVAVGGWRVPPLSSVLLASAPDWVCMWWRGEGRGQGWGQGTRQQRVSVWGEGRGQGWGQGSRQQCVFP